MPDRLVPLLLVVAVLAVAGCTTSASTATHTATATGTATPTATMTTTETPTVTTSDPTTVPSGDDIPVVLDNGDDERHTLRVSVANGSTVIFNDTVSVEAEAERTVATLRGPETTYRIQATLDDESIDENVTLYPGLLESQIEIDDSGGLEYTTLVN